MYSRSVQLQVGIQMCERWGADVGGHPDMRTRWVQMHAGIQKCMVGGCRHERASRCVG